MNSIEQLIAKLDLQPHPEGGYFRETYRSDGNITSKCLPDNYSGDRNYATGIYFLLTSDTFSAFHKIHQDEMWHFYDGAAIRLHIISPEGTYSEVLIGKDLNNNEYPQFVVPGGHWFAAEVSGKNAFSLAGCTVSPGFDFADFNMPSRDELLALYPQHADVVQKLTRV